MTWEGYLQILELKNLVFFDIIYYRWGLAQPKQSCGSNSIRFLFNTEILKLMIKILDGC